MTFIGVFCFIFQLSITKIVDPAGYTTSCVSYIFKSLCHFSIHMQGLLPCKAQLEPHLTELNLK